MKATFDAIGNPTGFYDPDIHGDAIPKEAVDITPEQWRAFINNPGLRRWADGAVIAVAPPVPADKPSGDGLQQQIDTLRTQLGGAKGLARLAALAKAAP